MKYLLHLLLCLVMFLVVATSVSALGPIFEQHTGCNDPSLNWAGKGFSQCIEVVSCTGPFPDMDDAAHGRLFQDNTYYLLMNDITSNMTCIWYEADNSVFDLNSHTITFGKIGVEGIPNHDFEIAGATEQDAADWNLSAAPHAFRLRDDYMHLSNRYLMRFEGVTSPETITSDWIWLNVTGRSYDGYVTFETCGGSTLFEVEREEGGTACSGSADDNYCNFLVSTPGRYRLSITVGSGDCRVDFADIRPRMDVGIIIPTFYTNLNVFPDYPSHDPPNIADAHIKNGKIIEPERGSSFGKSIYNAAVHDVLVENMYLENHGYDSFNIRATSGTTLRDSEIVNTNTFTRNRHQLYGPAEFTGGNNKVYNNIFSGGQGNLFFTGTTNAPYPTGNEAYNNVFFNNMTVVTNHYMVTNYHVNGVKVYNNSFSGSAPGVLFSGHTMNSEAYGNFFNLTTMPCLAEYPRGYSTSAFRLTDYGNPDSTENNHIYNNIIYGKGIFYPDYPQCNPSIRGFHISTGSANNLYENNYVSLTTEDDNSYAYVVHQGYDNGGTFYNNTLASSQFVAWLANDYVSSSANILFDSNNFVRNGNDPRFHTIAYGYCCAGGYSLNNIFLNNTYLNGASIDDMYPNTNDHNTEAEYTIKWYLNIFVNDGVVPLNGATATIMDFQGNTVFSNKAISSGHLLANLTQYYAYTPDAYRPDPAPWEYTQYSPYNVSVTYNGETQLQQVTLDSSKQLTFTFSLSGCSLPLDQPTCNCIDSGELVNTINAWYADYLSLSQLMGNINAWRLCSSD